MSKRVQTIEKTGKGWKLAQLVGGLLMFLGFFGGLASGLLLFAVLDISTLDGLTHETTAGFRPIAIGLAVVLLVCLLAAPIGLLLRVFGRLGAWWYHG
ncbi:MAG: hypothetical protein AAF823_10855 [Planctomycetota bacterium]